MAHILFDGDIGRHPDLRSLFWQWGVTVGRLPSSAGDGSRVSVEECDAVVSPDPASGTVHQVFSAMPDGAEKEGVAVPAAAPLLVIGPNMAADLAWVVIPHPGPGGALLKAALQSCQERAGVLRGNSGDRHDRRQFREFLGHELRSPMTAIRTALTILESEKIQSPGPARMLGLAQRNLSRLAQTVEWSQELMSLAEATPAPCLETVAVGDLVRAFPDHMDLKLEGMSNSGEVYSDPVLVAILAGQMKRVLSHACPEGVPEFRLGCDPDSVGYCLSATIQDKGEESSVPRVSRTGEGSPEPGNRAEFVNLVRMLISPALLQVLGARVRVAPVAVAEYKIILDLPAETPSWVNRPDPSVAV